MMWAVDTDDGCGVAYNTAQRGHYYNRRNRATTTRRQDMRRFVVSALLLLGSFGVGVLPASAHHRPARPRPTALTCSYSPSLTPYQYGGGIWVATFPNGLTGCEYAVSNWVIASRFEVVGMSTTRTTVTLYGYYFA